MLNMMLKVEELFKVFLVGIYHTVVQMYRSNGRQKKTLCLKQQQVYHALKDQFLQKM